MLTCDDLDLLISIECPLPPRDLHPNARPHHRAKWRATKTQRSAAGIAALDALNSLREHWVPIDNCIIQMRFLFPKGSKKHDPDNLIAWCKSTIDGICDAKVLSNDRSLIYLPPLQMRSADCQRGLLTIDLYRQR